MILEIPEGALSAPVDIQISKAELQTTAFQKTSAIYRFEPHGTQFAIPATVRIPVDQSLAADPAAEMFVWWSDAPDGEWEQISASVYAQQTHSVSAPIDHLSFGASGQPTAPTTPTADPYDGLNAYFGDIHSHTLFSDGEDQMSDAIAFARDTAKLDFVAITDHSWTQLFVEWGKPNPDITPPRPRSTSSPSRSGSGGRSPATSGADPRSCRARTSPNASISKRTLPSRPSAISTIAWTTNA